MSMEVILREHVEHLGQRLLSNVDLAAEETEDPRILEEASRTMESAVHELEHARRMLMEAHSTRVWGPDLRGIYTTVFG